MYKIVEGILDCVFQCKLNPLALIFSYFPFSDRCVLTILRILKIKILTKLRLIIFMTKTKCITISQKQKDTQKS